MSLLTRSFPAPLHVDISAGAINRLHEVISDTRIAPDARVAVILSTGSGVQFRAQIEKQIAHADFFELSDGSLQSAEAIAGKLTNYSSVVGVGGGRVLDAAKYAASKANLPMIAVATNLAHDGIASPVSILEHDGTRSSHGVSVPAAVLIDLDIVRSGPVRFLRAGIGDVLSNLNAVADWELAREVNGEEVDGLAASMSRTAATSLLNHPGTINDSGFLTTLAEGLVLSGLAMAVAGTSRPCSGACHEISHAIDMVLPEKSAPHGEQVAVGALFATYLRGATAEFGQLHDALFRHGLPTSPKDLGLTTEQFAQAVAFAPQTRPDRFTILEHKNLDQAQLLRVVSDFVAAL
jgi:glycerol-1-phosphate dehydrogenase [NAD(P)+]